MFVCGANSLEQTQGQHLGFATNKIQQINQLASSPSFPLSLPPCLPSPLFLHLAETYEIKTVKTFQGNSHLLWIIIHWIYAHHGLSRQSVSHPSLAPESAPARSWLRRGTVLSCGDEQLWWQHREAKPGWHCVTSPGRSSAQQGTNAEWQGQTVVFSCSWDMCFVKGLCVRLHPAQGEVMFRTRQGKLEVNCKRKGTCMLSDRSIITMNYQPV